MTEKRAGAPRLVEANRQQTRLVPMDLEGLLPLDHQARAVWSFVSRLNLIEFHERIQSREGAAGRPATDPQILLALWILATLEGIGSAREIARLCDVHLAYQWVCGGVAVNHHTLSDFRNLSTDQLSGLLTQSVAGLLSEGLAEMQRVAHDGMKVRASAGSSSFRRRARLKELHKLAKEQVETLSKEIDDDSGAASRREQGARKRAAEERERRVDEALKQLAKAEEEARTRDRKREEKREKRTSVTDPQARMMKMADGGFRPAYNIHLATTTDRGVIVAVNVNNESTDQRAMLPLMEDLESRHGVRPTEWLADGGCTSNANIDGMSKHGCKVYAPLRERKTKPTRKDSAAVAEWRERMTNEDAKSIYQLRGQTAEWVNARFRGQGLTHLLVRGLEKVRAVALLHAITHNLRQGIFLQA